MPRLARGEYLNPNDVQVVHTVQRCVRRAFLCGDDPVSGVSFEHRRAWIRSGATAGLSSSANQQQRLPSTPAISYNR